MIEIYCGKFDSISSLKEKNKIFNLNDPELTLNLLELSFKGMKMKEAHNQFDIPNSTDNLVPILNKLMLVIFKAEETSSNKTDSNKGLNSNKLYRHLDTLVNAVWGDYRAENTILKAIQEGLKDKDNELNSIWTEFQENSRLILQK